MKRFFYSLIIVLILWWTYPLWEEPIREVLPVPLNNLIDSISEHTGELLEKNDYLKKLRGHLSSPELLAPHVNDRSEQETDEKIELLAPKSQTFSIGNVELGDTYEQVAKIYGDPVRESMNEYGLAWFTYHENYQNFIMIAFDDDEIVRGLYTNQDLISSTLGIKLGDSKTTVNNILGEPEELIHYRQFIYQVDSDNEYDIYQIDGSYVTIFYDIQADDQVTAIQLIDQKLELTKEALYPAHNEALREGFEYQLFDLTNASRVKQGLSVLEWEEAVRETARKHSTDMAENEFFNHTNLQNETFSDRLINDGIRFIVAGENLAYGQFSSIFAHQGLMNSPGHRENILYKDFTKLGIGVDFNESNQPFYTEMFYAD